MSYPVSWAVVGSVDETSSIQIPVPVPISAILRVGEVSVREMLGWIRKPRVWVVKMCCSSSLYEVVSIRSCEACEFSLHLSGISSP